jgi:hypothetical protein
LDYLTDALLQIANGNVKGTLFDVAMFVVGVWKIVKRLFLHL